MDTTGNSIYSGKTIALDADINLNGHSVKGIGGGSNFAGVFDGQGHSISNFKIDASDRDYYAGLFNQVSHGGTVKNLIVKGATVIGTSMVGAVASSVDSNAVVDNCKAINCTLIGKKKVGAVVGYSAGSTVTNNYAENCTVYYSEKEGAEVLGFENTASTVSNNTYEIVSVIKAAAATNGDELENDLEVGGNVVLASDISGVNANNVIAVSSGVDVILDLNGHKISSVANKTGNQELFLVKGTMTVKNGSLEIVAENNQGWNAMTTLFDVTSGGVLNLEGVTANVYGSDMNFVVHLNNWGEATLNVNNCDFTTTYCAVRAFNSGYDMNNVTIKNTDFHGGRMFWVHNYTSEGKDDSTLNLNIYNNNNTCDNAKPVRFGFSNSVYYDLNGNVIN